MMEWIGMVCAKILVEGKISSTYKSVLEGTKIEDRSRE